MKLSSHRAALARACASISNGCEPLEQRRLLSGDPVIVLHEGFASSYVSTIAPYLWHNPSETSFDLATANSWNTTDGSDTDHYADDYYGWNFVNNTPNVAYQVYSPHGTDVNGDAVAALSGEHGGPTSSVGVSGLLAQVRETIPAEDVGRTRTISLGITLLPVIIDRLFRDIRA